MSIHHANPLIYLASASPRRSALLQQIGVVHEVQPVDIDESVQPSEGARAYVQRLACGKAQALWERLPAALRRPVLGADTAVVLDGRILGKPLDEQDHRGMLEQLSGQVHEVHTAVALRYDNGIEVRLSVSRVAFRTLQQAEIAAYWWSGEPQDKAGGYAIQGVGSVFVTDIQGSYSGIVGLPLYETGQLLQMIGWSPVAKVRCG